MNTILESPSLAPKTENLRHRRHTLNANMSYTAMIREAGLKPGRRLLRKLVRLATAEEAAALIQPHPSLSETFGETLLALAGRGLHLG